MCVAVKAKLTLYEMKEWRKFAKNNIFDLLIRKNFQIERGAVQNSDSIRLGMGPLLELIVWRLTNDALTLHRS